MTSVDDVRAKFPQYEAFSDGDLLMAVHRRFYPSMHPRQFLNNIEGAANAHATITRDDLKEHWRSGASKPLPGENPEQTAQRLGGTASGDVSTGGRAVAGVRSAMQGMTFGTSDEAVAKVASLLSGNSYDFELDRERRRLAQGEAEYPGQSIAAEMGGAILAPGAAVKTVKGAVAAGTGGGMAYAAGKGEGGAKERGKDALAAAPASLFFSSIAVPAQRAFSKGFRRLVKGAEEKPSIGRLKAIRSQAYKAVDESGFQFSAEELDGALSKVYARLDEPTSGYVKGDAKTEAALKILENNWGKPMTLSEVDKVRSRIWKRWASAAPDEAQVIQEIIGAIDEMIESADGANAVLAPARQAHKDLTRFQLLDAEFKKMANRTAVTGSGGNIYNNYGKVFERIVDNPKLASKFTDDQLAFFRAAIDTSAGESALRRLGKLSPEGNGLMLALNIIGGTVEPTLFAVGGAGAVAKRSAEKAMESRVDDALLMSAGMGPRRPVTTPTQVPTAASVGALSWERNRPR